MTILLYRILWQITPGLATCGLFWAAALAWNLRDLVRGAPYWPGRVLVLTGASLNATVTLANGGYMPVVGGAEGWSLWVTATDRHRLLWLADRYAGFSLGDFVLLAGIVVLVGGWLRDRRSARYRVARDADVLRDEDARSLRRAATVIDWGLDRWRDAPGWHSRADRVIEVGRRMRRGYGTSPLARMTADFDALNATTVTAWGSGRSSGWWEEGIERVGPHPRPVPGEQRGGVVRAVHRADLYTADRYLVELGNGERVEARWDPTAPIMAGSITPRGPLHAERDHVVLRYYEDGWRVERVLARVGE